MTCEVDGLDEAPEAHEWTRKGVRLWRCPWCGACRRDTAMPHEDAPSQPEAVAHYETLQRYADEAVAKRPHLRRPWPDSWKRWPQNPTRGGRLTG